MTDSIEENGDPDDNAETCIAVMVMASVGAAIIPGPVNWALFSAALGAGVVSIGHCYGVKLDGDEAWKLVKQFFLSAGFAFLALAVGSKILAAILTVTGLGYVAAVPMDAAISGSIAFAVGKSGKAYFKGERNKDRLGEIFRNAFRENNSNPKS